MAVWYCSSTRWTAVATWLANEVVGVGAIRRQLATPTVGQERVFRCTTAGTCGAAEPAPWTLTKGSTTNDNTAVWTEITGNSTYGWTAPHSRLVNALAVGWPAAGDTIYVGHDHAATQAASVTYASSGTSASPIIVQCVDDAANPPTTIASTASETVTGNSNISVGAAINVRGIIFNGGTGASGGNITLASANNLVSNYEDCAFNIVTTDSTARIGAGTQGGGAGNESVYWRSCNVSFGHISQAITPAKPFFWQRGAVTGATIPAIVFTTAVATAAIVSVRGVDFSICSGALVTAASVKTFLFEFHGCLLHATVSPIFALALVSVAGEVRLFNCDSADTNYRYAVYNFQATCLNETTIVKTGGATDGTTPISRKVSGNAGNSYWNPWKSDRIPVWIETIGASFDIGIDIVNDGVTLTNAEAWIEVESQDLSASTPLTQFSEDRSGSILEAAANQATSTATWTTTGLASPVKQKLEINIEPLQKGLIYVRVCYAKGSGTIYYDPKPTGTGFTSGRQYQVGESYLNEGQGSGGGGAAGCIIRG